MSTKHVVLVTERRGSRRVVSDGFMEALLSTRRVTVSAMTTYPPPELDRKAVYVVLGSPGWLLHMSQRDVGAMNAGKLEVWLMLAPNSNKIPEDMLTMLRTMPGLRIMTPSAWAQGVLHALGLNSVVVPHGCRVDGDHVAAPNTGPWRVLHFTSTSRERKGTGVLLDAWVKAKSVGDIPDDAELHLIAPVEAVAYSWSNYMEHGAFTLPQIAASAPGLFDRASYVCQPSRGEAFGLVPLEALASGVRVIATTCTGHSQYLDSATDGLVEVPTGRLAPIDDLPGAMAPSLSVDDLAQALGRAYAAPPPGPDWQFWRQAWSWPAVLKPWITRLLDGSVLTN